MTSPARPKECETSSYRHGCDPPECNLSTSPLSDPKDYPPIPASNNRVIELQPLLLAWVFRFHKNQERNYERMRIREVGGQMQAATLTTTLSELNRLFGRYYELIDKKPSLEAEGAWMEYVAYVKRYNEERGLNMSLEARRRM